MTPDKGPFYVVVPRVLVIAASQHINRLKHIPTEDSRSHRRYAFYHAQTGLRPKLMRAHSTQKLYDCFLFDSMSEIVQFKLTHCPGEELQFITPLPGIPIRELIL